MESRPNLLNPANKLAYRVKEWAKIVSVSPEFIRAQIKSGDLKAHRVGTKNIIILVEDAENWLRSQLIKPENDGVEDKSVSIAD